MSTTRKLYAVYGMYLGDMDDHKIGTIIAASETAAINAMDEVVNDPPFINRIVPHIWITRAVETDLSGGQAAS